MYLNQKQNPFICDCVRLLIIIYPFLMIGNKYLSLNNIISDFLLQNDLGMNGDGGNIYETRLAISRQYLKLNDGFLGLDCVIHAPFLYG